jgi:hypothetical protein
MYSEMITTYKYEVRGTKYEVEVRSSFFNDNGRLFQQIVKVNDHCSETTCLQTSLRTSYLVLRTLFESQYGLETFQRVMVFAQYI